MITLYDSILSGNGYKARLLMSHLGIPFRRVSLTLPKGESRTPEMLKRNPLGRVPILELENGESLYESNAILCYLAAGTPFLPENKLEHARVVQWLLFEQFDLVRNLARPRLYISIQKAKAQHLKEIADYQELGYKALGVMEAHLVQGRDWFVGERYTIADIALYSYTHMSPEGEYDLARFPAIQAWLRRVESQKGYIPLMAQNRG
jgi:glutathione S-transferase